MNESALGKKAPMTPEQVKANVDAMGADIDRVLAGEIPVDAPIGYIKPVGDAVPNDPPAWFGPTYQPPDVDRAAAFVGPLAGITGRLEKLRGHLTYLGFKTPDEEAKIEGLMFATGMLVDLVDELAKEVAKSMPADDESADGAADQTAQANADGPLWSVTGADGSLAATGPNDEILRVKPGADGQFTWKLIDDDGSTLAQGSAADQDAAKAVVEAAVTGRAAADWTIPVVVTADDIRSALETSHPGMAQVLSESIIAIVDPAVGQWASDGPAVALLMSTRDAIYTAIEHLSGVEVQELPKLAQMAVTSIQAAGLAIEASFEMMGIDDEDDGPDFGGSEESGDGRGGQVALP